MKYRVEIMSNTEYSELVEKFIADNHLSNVIVTKEVKASVWAGGSKTTKTVHIITFYVDLIGIGSIKKYLKEHNYKYGYILSVISDESSVKFGVALDTPKFW